MSRRRRVNRRNVRTVTRVCCNLVLFAGTGNVGDFLLDVFDCVAHAGRQGATLVQKTRAKDKRRILVAVN